ncbi:hypothetical protein CR513_25088, partial [Mucuna pruriens]
MIAKTCIHSSPHHLHDEAMMIPSTSRGTNAAPQTLAISGQHSWRKISLHCKKDKGCYTLPPKTTLFPPFCRASNQTFQGRSNHTHWWLVLLNQKTKMAENDDSLGLSLSLSLGVNQPPPSKVIHVHNNPQQPHNETLFADLFPLPGTRVLICHIYP